MQNEVTSASITCHTSFSLLFWPAESWVSAEVDRDRNGRRLEEIGAKTMGRARDTREGGVSCVACLPRAPSFFLRLLLPPATQVVRDRIKCSLVVESVVISLLQCLKLIKASRCSCLGGLRKTSTLKTWSY